MQALHPQIKGKDIAESIMKLIRKAEEEIVIASYILSDFNISGQDGTMFDLLSQKVEEGVNIYLILGMDPPDYVLDRLKDLPKITVRICPRVHMKIILVDGKYGFFPREISQSAVRESLVEKTKL